MQEGGRVCTSSTESVTKCKVLEYIQPVTETEMTLSLGWRGKEASYSHRMSDFGLEVQD